MSKPQSLIGNLPCSTCPWRVDQDARSIPHYAHNKACDLLTSTTGEGDNFRKIMACHKSTEDNNRACRGYLARVGWTNINVRALLALNEIEHPDECLYACETYGVELEPDYQSVLRKLAASHVGQENS